MKKLLFSFLLATVSCLHAQSTVLINTTNIGTDTLQVGGTARFNTNFSVINPSGGTVTLINTNTTSTQTNSFPSVYGPLAAQDAAHTSGIAGWNSLGQLVASTNTFVSVHIQYFTTSGTYTPSTGMAYCYVEAWGGGGGGGSGTAPSGGNAPCAGGEAGAYSAKLYTAAQIGSSQSVTIGAGGAGASSSSAATGSSGGQTTFGSTLNLTAPGGVGGDGNAGGTGFNIGSANYGSSGSNADISSPGPQGQNGYGSGVVATAGSGGTPAGGVGTGGYGYTTQYTTGSAAPGQDGEGYAAGGSGALSINGTHEGGGDGTTGLVRVTEYCTQ